jgi:ankyrin repeat protein
MGFLMGPINFIFSPSNALYYSHIHTGNMEGSKLVFDLCVQGMRASVEGLLRRHGADIDVNAYKNMSGWSSLHAGVLSGDESLVQLLLDHKADPSAVTHKGENALALSRARLGHVSLSMLMVLSPRRRSGVGREDEATPTTTAQQQG